MHQRWPPPLICRIATPFHSPIPPSLYSHPPIPWLLRLGNHSPKAIAEKIASESDNAKRRSKKRVKEKSLKWIQERRKRRFNMDDTHSSRYEHLSSSLHSLARDMVVHELENISPSRTLEGRESRCPRRRVLNHFFNLVLFICFINCWLFPTLVILVGTQ